VFSQPPPGIRKGRATCPPLTRLDIASRRPSVSFPPSPPLLCLSHHSLFTLLIILSVSTLSLPSLSSFPSFSLAPLVAVILSTNIAETSGLHPAFPLDPLLPSSYCPYSLPHLNRPSYHTQLASCAELAQSGAWDGVVGVGVEGRLVGARASHPLSLPPLANSTPFVHLPASLIPALRCPISFLPTSDHRRDPLCRGLGQSEGARLGPRHPRPVPSGVLGLRASPLLSPPPFPPSLSSLSSPCTEPLPLLYTVHQHILVRYRHGEGCATSSAPVCAHFRPSKSPSPWHRQVSRASAEQRKVVATLPLPFHPPQPSSFLPSPLTRDLLSPPSHLHRDTPCVSLVSTYLTHR